MKTPWRTPAGYQRPNQLLSWSILLISVAISGVLITYLSARIWQVGQQAFDKFLAQQRQTAIQEAMQQTLGGGGPAPEAAPCLPKGALIELIAPTSVVGEPQCGGDIPDAEVEKRKKEWSEKVTASMNERLSFAFKDELSGKYQDMPGTMIINIPAVLCEHERYSKGGGK